MANERAFRDGETVPGTRYRVARLVGRGGMGCVYEVEHLELGKRFVLKALLRQLAFRADVESRLRNEWRALGRLEHPNIVTVTDAGVTTTQISYYVMERLEGETLSRRLRRDRRLPWAEAVRIIADVLAALGAAHRLGIVHRDIKPSNIFLVSDGGAKLLDFGIAKIATSAEALTASGVALGTPRYMSPEQVRAGAIDGRADLYAAGLVFYEMLAGCGPFDPVRGANELLLAHLARNPVPIGELVAGLPREIAQIVMWLLARQPEQRPADADEARHLLLQALTSGSEGDALSWSDPDDDLDAPTRQVRTAPIDPRLAEVGFAPTEASLVAVRTEPLGVPVEVGPMGTVRDVALPLPPGPPPRGKGQTMRLPISEEIAATRTAVPVRRPPVSITPPPVTAPRDAPPPWTLRRDLALAAMAMLGVVVVGFAAVGFWSLVTPDVPVDQAAAAPVEAGHQRGLSRSAPRLGAGDPFPLRRASVRRDDPVRVASASPLPGLVPSAPAAVDRGPVTAPPAIPSARGRSTPAPPLQDSLPRSGLE